MYSNFLILHKNMYLEKIHLPYLYVKVLVFIWSEGLNTFWEDISKKVK